jgi:hypothetical protein
VKADHAGSTFAQGRRWQALSRECVLAQESKTLDTTVEMAATSTQGRNLRCCHLMGWEGDGGGYPGRCRRPLSDGGAQKPRAQMNQTRGLQRAREGLVSGPGGTTTAAR